MSEALTPSSESCLPEGGSEAFKVNPRALLFSISTFFFHYSDTWSLLEQDVYHRLVTIRYLEPRGQTRFEERPFYLCVEIALLKTVPDAL